MRTVAVLGATGSIGRQALDLIERHSGDFKASVLTANQNREALYDLVNDPGEQCNCAADSAFVDELIRHRALLEQHVAATADDFFTREASVASRWRTHTPGWQHHRGIAAPMEG